MILKDGMILYHGSYTAINKIDLSKCSDGKDFGKGFYVSDNLKQAKGFIKTSLIKAKGLKKIPESQNYGFVTAFRYHAPKDDIPFFAFDSAGVDWLWFVSMNRRHEMADDFRDNLKKELLSSEIVIGKIANDTTNPTIIAYLNGLYGNIKSETAIQFAISQLMPDRLKEQCCFLSERAISCLEFVEAKRYDE